MLLCKQTSALLLGAFCLLLLSVDVSARRNVYNLKPKGDGKYAVPMHPTNAYWNVTYACLIIDANNFKTYGEEWMVKLFNKNDQAVVHHTVFYTVPTNSALLAPGALLANAQNGDMIDDCMAIGLGPGHILYADQAGNDNLDLLASFGDDNSTANGYPYGIPIGSQIDARFFALQMHIHNDQHEAGLRVPIDFQIHTTTDAPTESLGFMMYGVPLPMRNLPSDIFFNIPVNTQGTYTISGTTRPAIHPNCSASAEAIPCVSCCPSTSPVRSDNGFEGMMSAKGLSQIKIVANFLHAHHNQKLLQSWTISLNGTETPLDSCASCGHGRVNGNAFHILPEPVLLKAGDGMRIKCTYDRHGHSSTTGNIKNGYGSDDEMCVGFAYFAYNETPVNEAPLLLYAGICDFIQNEGFDSEKNALDNYPPYKAIFCKPTCNFDTECPK